MANIKHTLKIGPERLDNLISGKKKSEIRLNDRDYQSGDVLHFQRIEGVSRPETVSHYFTVTHVHSGLGLQDGYVVLSFEKGCK